MIACEMIHSNFQKMFHRALVIEDDVSCHSDANFGCTSISKRTDKILYCFSTFLLAQKGTPQHSEVSVQLVVRSEDFSAQSVSVPSVLRSSVIF